MKPYTTYAIEIIDSLGERNYVRLTAHTDQGAMLQMRRYLKHYANPSESLLLTWYRPADECHGYINPDGAASPNGKFWRH
ncbi:MAG TPA: hypothetical protein VFV58_39440 [Blastocatellia bacterium]|jgi:hypothetical protein|nr:hypothetical protein [Blastocatellia bacterium]